MIALLSTQVANEFAKKTGIEVLALKEYRRLDTPVSSHADLLICKIENTVFCYEDYYLENRSIFEKIENNYKVVKVSKNCSREYPFSNIVRIKHSLVYWGEKSFHAISLLSIFLKNLR